MLVLSRKTGQQIRIGEHITITVVKTQGQNVRLGIEAPRDVRVVRAELPPINQQVEPAEAEQGMPLAAKAGVQLHRPPSRHPQREVADAQRRTHPAHPQRWTVASMRQRVQTLSGPRSAAKAPELAQG